MTEPQVVLEISGDDGPSRFRGLLMPDDYVAVSGLPIDRLGDVAAGRIVISPPADSRLDEQAVGPGEMRVLPDAFADTATIMLKLTAPVAIVSIPDSTADEFHALMQENNQDVIATLESAGISTQLLPQPWEPPADYQPDRSQPPLGWAPYGPPPDTEFGICCFCKLFCCRESEISG